MNKIRVLIADDHAIVRAGFAALINAETDIEVVGEAKNGIEAIREAVRLAPDVVVMDILMPRKDGLTATQELHEALPSAKILILTSVGSSDEISRALAAGASGALLKNDENQNIVAAIRDVVRGKNIISREARRMMREDPPKPTLSPRQQEILRSLTRGLSNDDIAKQLGISLPTVKTHLTVLFNKIGAGSRTEAVAIALRKHLLKL